MTEKNFQAGLQLYNRNQQLKNALESLGITRAAVKSLVLKAANGALSSDEQRNLNDAKSRMIDSEMLVEVLRETSLPADEASLILAIREECEGIREALVEHETELANQEAIRLQEFRDAMVEFVVKWLSTGVSTHQDQSITMRYPARILEKIALWFDRSGHLINRNFADFNVVQSDALLTAAFAEGRAFIIEKNVVSVDLETVKKGRKAEMIRAEIESAILTGKTTISEVSSVAASERTDTRAELPFGSGELSITETFRHMKQDRTRKV